MNIHLITLFIPIIAPVIFWFAGHLLLSMVVDVLATATEQFE